MDERVTVQLTQGLREFVRVQAEREGRSESSVIRRLIAEAERREHRGHRAA